MTIDSVNNEPTSPTTKFELDEWKCQSEATLQRTASRLRFWTWPYVILFGFFAMIFSVALLCAGHISNGLKEFSFGIVAIGLTWLGRRGAKELSIRKLLPYLLYLLIAWLFALTIIYLASTRLPTEMSLIVFLVVALIIISPPLYLSASLCVQIRLHARHRVIYSAPVEEMTVPDDLVNNKPTSPTTKTELDEWERQKEAILRHTASRLLFWIWPYVILAGFLTMIISVANLYNGDIQNGLIRFFSGIVAIGLTWLGRRGAKELSFFKLLPYLLCLLIIWLNGLMTIYSVSTQLLNEVTRIVALVILNIVIIIVSAPLYLSAKLCVQIHLHARRRTIYSALVEKSD